MATRWPRADALAAAMLENIEGTHGLCRFVVHAGGGPNMPSARRVSEAVGLAAVVEGADPASALLAGAWKPDQPKGSGNYTGPASLTNMGLGSGSMQ